LQIIVVLDFILFTVATKVAELIATFSIINIKETIQRTLGIIAR
jgi:hypothetical protein